MNEEIKLEWVDALLNGGYDKIHHHLSDSNNGRCVMGVLCDIACTHGLLSKNGSIYNDTVGRTYIGTTPEIVAFWAGLNYEEVLDLEEMNDKPTSCITLAEFADMIKNGTI